jgi:hypothetical protein
MSAEHGASTWTLLTGHGHVLVAIAKNPRARIRDLAQEAGLTERSTQAIIADLEEAGYITRRRVGRRSAYTIHAGQSFRHQSQDGLLVGPFLALLAGSMASRAMDGGDDADDGDHGDHGGGPDSGDFESDDAESEGPAAWAE